MDNNNQTTPTGDNNNETECLRTAVCELNESVAYLSKMVLQLQKSLAEKSAQAKTDNTRAANKQTHKAAAENKKPVTVH